MISEKLLMERLEGFVNEELQDSDLREIRKLIRQEIANVLFDLFKKRGVWV
jgi:predicted component of type VI protein secretion system